MEEKERYEWNSRFDEAIKDNQTGNIVNAVEVLNKQDKRIKELEETNKVLSNELTKNSILKQDHIETCCGIPIFEIPKIKEENQQLKQQLEKSEKSKESYRLQNEDHHLKLLQFYSRLGVEAFGADIHEKALETLMIMKEQLAEKDLAIENWQTMYESVVQTCHNDKEEIERLNKQLAEKDKEIEELKLKLDIRAISLQNFNIERMQANQDKISFAIEQLEKVLVLIQNAVNIDSPEYDLVGLYDAVSNQIKQLKEMK